MSKGKNKTKLNDGDLVELITPKFAKTYGQGAPPAGIKMRIKKEKFELKYGSLIKVSDDEGFNPANGIGELDAVPHPIIKIDFLIKHNIGYKKINQ